jgi:hypothetical protein
MLRKKGRHDVPLLYFWKIRDTIRFNSKSARGYSDYWSVRVSRDIRTVGKRTGDTIEWAWIGTHNEFDKLFG